jgi:hypothetical protein
MNEPDDAILAEYDAVRHEISQLNGQVFTVMGSALTLNTTALGWYFKDNVEKYYVPTIGILFLFFGTIILLNRDRMAHRLALFQRYFIEPRAPQICWGRVYFAYREHYRQKQEPKKTFLIEITERLSGSGAFVLAAASAMNVCVLIYWGVRPCWEAGAVDVDWGQVCNLVVAGVLVALQFIFKRIMTNYEPIKRTLHAIANDCGLAPAEPTPVTLRDLFRHSSNR